MDYRFLIISRKDVKVIVLGVLIGGVLQIIAYKYLEKNHPELLINKTKDKIDSTRGIRGGALAEAVTLIVLLAEKGAWFGFFGGILLVGWDKIPRTSLSVISEKIRKGLPVTHSNYELDYEKKFVIVDGEKIWLDQCDQNLEYLWKILNDKTIKPEEKNRQCLSILTNYLNLNTHRGRLNFIFCLLAILRILSVLDFTSYYMLLDNLIKALKAGKIPKRLVRRIVRKLLREKIPVDPELVQLVDVHD